MPNWTPNWRDVAFNHAAAHQYAETCRQSAATLRRILNDRAVAAGTATLDWEGKHRQTFDRGIRSWAQQAETVIARLRYIANQVEAASGQAVQEQSRRDEDRRRWHAADTFEREQAEHHARIMEQQRIEQQRIEQQRLEHQQAPK